LGSINDANGTVDSLEIFENGFSELYKSVEFGYSPSRQERYLKNIHVMFWQMDERNFYGKDNTSSDGSEGIVVGVNYTWNDEWMVFGKLGLSTVDSDSQLYEQQTTIGFIKYFREHSDLFGLSLSYGQIPDEFGTPNPSQTTVESFYRFQLAKNLAITPNIQYLIDPALNTKDDILVLGVRLRFTL
jgi:porin